MPKNNSAKVYPPRNNLWVIAGLILLGIIIYSNTFSSPFHFDDTKSITDNPGIKDIRNLKAIWNFWPTRFVTYFSVALNYHFNNLRVFGYHFVNLAIHLISALLVWWLVLLTFLTPGLKDKKISQHAWIIALFSGLIFVAHPLQTQGVTYIIQRAVSLASMFYLASFCLYVKARLSQQARYYYASLILAVLAMFSKEMACSLPFMILLYESYFFNEGKGLPWKKLLPFFIALTVIPLTMWLSGTIDFVNMRRLVEVTPLKFSYGDYLLTQPPVFLTYVRLVFIPFNQNLDYDYPIYQSLFNPHVLISLAVIILILAVAFKLRFRYQLLSFGIFWFFIALLPEASIRIQDVIFEHRLYLAMAGFGIFVSSVLFYFLPEKRNKAIIIFLAILVVAYSLKTYNRNAVWQSEYALWTDTLLKSPSKERPYHNRGFSYQAQEKYDEAIADYNKALAIDNTVVETYTNRGNALRGKEKFDLAIADFDAALKINPLSDEAYAGRGSAWASKGELEKAITDFSRAIQIKPNDSKIYNDRGNVYGRMKKYDLAIADYTKALEISPFDADIYFNRANTYSAQGRLDEATGDFERIIRINPNYGAVYFSLGNTWKDKGDFPKAIENYSKAIMVDPRNLGALHNRAVAYFLTKDYEKSWEDVHRLREQGADIHPAILKQLKEASGRED